MSRVSHLKRGDIVYVRSGDHKGKTGRVLRVNPETRTAVVEGVNYVKRHMRKTQDNPKGGIVEKEAPLAVSALVRFDEARARKTGAKASA
jgi:large subunit ribosomal protein L24